MLGLSGRLWKTSGSSALTLDSFPWPLRVQRLADWRNPVRRGVPTPKENGDPYGVAVTAIAEVSRLKVAAGRGGGTSALAVLVADVVSPVRPRSFPLATFMHAAQVPVVRRSSS